MQKFWLTKMFSFPLPGIIISSAIFNGKATPQVLYEQRQDPVLLMLSFYRNYNLHPTHVPGLDPVVFIQIQYQSLNNIGCGFYLP